MYQLCLKNIDSVLWTIQSEGIHSVKILEVFSRCYLNAFRVISENILGGVRKP